MTDKTTTGQRLIQSAKEALAFARGEANKCVVHYSNEGINTDAKCPVIPVQDIVILHIYQKHLNYGMRKNKEIME